MELTVASRTKGTQGKSHKTGIKNITARKVCRGTVLRMAQVWVSQDGSSKMRKEP